MSLNAESDYCIWIVFEIYPDFLQAKGVQQDLHLVTDTVAHELLLQCSQTTVKFTCGLSEKGKGSPQDASVNQSSIAPSDPQHLTDIQNNEAVATEAFGIT